MSPTSLAHLQKKVQSRILTASGSVQEVLSDRRADADSRLSVYSQAYRLRLLEILQNDYPGLWALVGGELFEQIGSQYIEAWPSRHFNARWFGQGLGSFLRASDIWAKRPEYAEMATYEWALTLSFDALDQPHAIEAQVALLAPEAWPEMQPTLLQSCQRLEVQWNTTDIRKAIDRGDAPPVLQRLNSPQSLLMWRKGLGIQYRVLEPDEAAALDGVKAHLNFAELCELLCQWHEPDRVALRAAGFLHRWVVDQCLAPIS